MVDAIISATRTLVLEFIKTASPNDLQKLNRGLWDIFAKVRDEKIKHFPVTPRQEEIHRQRLGELGL